MNAHELAARREKAMKLVAVLRQIRTPLSKVRSMSQESWKLAALAAGVHDPSEETRKMVVAQYAAEEPR